MCNRKMFFILLAVLTGLLSAAQTSQQQKLLPMLAPPSPEAAGLGRYGSYEVNLFTGVPNIGIPIYDIQVGELKLPITLSYHASGIKVSETPSRAGLGWSLNAGGTITRKIQGRPDEQPNNYFSASATSEYRVKLSSEIDPYSDAGMDYLSKVDTRYYDVEPDIFSYNLPGHSGRFLFNQKDNFKPYLIPYSPIDVSKTVVNPYAINFSIKDEAGRSYLYNAQEVTSTSSGVGLNANTTSAWLLSHVISANKQDTIYLKYTPVSTSDQYENEYLVVNDNVTGGGDYSADMGNFSGEIVNTSTTSQRLDSILFPNGRIVFESAPEGRSDFNGIYSLVNRLKFIKIYNYDPASKAYNLLKVLQLFHSYFVGVDNSSLRLKLDSIQVQTFSNTPVQTYRFTYNTSFNLGNKLVKQKDYWGYFNNRGNYIPNTSTPTSIPKMLITYNAPPNAPTQQWVGGGNQFARDPDPTYMQVCMLQQITFPTGGYTQFEFETNQYLDDSGSPKYAGGLRIKSIKSYTATGATPLVKTYKYGANESSYGRSNFVLEQHFFVNRQNCQWVDPSFYPTTSICRSFSYKTMSTYFANPTNDIEGADGSPVVYPVVTEYEGDDVTNNGKIIYQFSDKTDAKTSLIGYGKPYFDSYQFVRGFLTNKSVFRKNGDGTYTIISEERKKYQYFPIQWSIGGVGLVVRKRTIHQGAYGGGTYDNIGARYISSCGMESTNQNNYDYNAYNIVSGDNKLVADTIIYYDQLNTSKYVLTANTYSYDDLTHLGVTQVQTKNSKNEVMQTNYTYPYTGGAYPLMDAQHIWDKVVTETKFTNGVQLAKQTTVYGSYSGNNFLPSSIQYQVKANPAETRASFNSYNLRGGVLEMQKSDDVKQAFVWDYKNMNVVAEISGASQTEVAYTSFEAEGAGGWSGVTSIGFANNGSITGKRAYTQSNFSFSKAGLNASGSYTVSYWSKSGAFAVNGTTGTSLRSFNGWTLYQHTVTSPTNGTMTVSGSGTIDELRLYPSAAQMKTYTHEPLVGVSSVCEVNNRIVYYYYDGVGRLLLVKDDNNKIVKQYCYNYQGQPGICSIYGNAAQSNSFTKNNCSSGTGTTVTYNVPANMYYANTQAEANTLALNEVNAHGQAYANATGSCTATLYNVTGSNNKSIGYTVTFRQPSTGTILYSFSLTSGISNFTFSQQVAAGTYDVQFQPGGSPVTANFGVNSLTMTGVNAATFYGVSITGNSTIRAY